MTQHTNLLARLALYLHRQKNVQVVQLHYLEPQAICPASALAQSQRLQYALIKEYSLNHIRGLTTM